MGTVISNLKARFGVDTSDFKKGLKDGEKATEDFKGAAGGILDDFASMFGVNMGAVNDALGTANKSLVFLGQSFVGAAKGGDILTISMKVLKFALISTGIGALIVVLGSVIAYFTKSGEGAAKLSKILAEFKSVLNNVVERMVAFGKGIVDFVSGKFAKGIKEMGSAFKGMGTEIKEDWKAAGALADAEGALKEKEITLITSLEERRAKIAELRLQAKEETEDQHKKLNLLNQAYTLTKSVYGDQVLLERERLRIMKENLAISTKDSTVEERKAIAEQEAKINGLLTEQAQDLKAIVREKAAATKIVNEEIALEKLKSEQIKVTNAAISNLKMPDFNQVLSTTLAPLAKIQKAVKEVSVDISSALNESFTNIATGMGEFLGALMIGNAGIKDFGKMMAGSFAELAINIGNITIKSAIAVGALDSILKMPGAWPIALAAGIALVALGAAIKGSLANVASGGGGGASVSSTSNTYDTRGAGSAQAQPIVIQINGKLTADGPDLKYVFDQEIRRKSTST